MSDLYRLDLFEPHVGTVFTALNVDQEGGHAITLVQAAAEPPQPDAPRRDPFTLVFEGVEGAYLPQATYVLRHETLGDVEVFLVPLGPDDATKRIRYEAVFN